MNADHAARKEDMRELRLTHGWTLQRIADKYSISRERVRQVIGNTGTISFRNSAVFKDDLFLEDTKHLTNDELCELLNVNYVTVSRQRGGIRHAVKGNGNVRKAFESEELASAWLKAKGINNELMAFRHPFDILALDRVRIDVKVAYGSCISPSQHNISPTWTFHVENGNKRDDTDFYLCIIAPTEEIFVIPAGKIPRNTGTIRFCWPTLRPELSNWQNYLDAYNLIFEFADNGNQSDGEK